jgi:hypothetical protein
MTRRTDRTRLERLVVLAEAAVAAGVLAFLVRAS